MWGLSALGSLYYYYLLYTLNVHLQASAAHYGPLYDTKWTHRRPDVRMFPTNQRRWTRPLTHSRQFRPRSARRPAGNRGACGRCGNLGRVCRWKWNWTRTQLKYRDKLLSSAPGDSCHSSEPSRSSCSLRLFLYGGGGGRGRCSRRGPRRTREWRRRPPGGRVRLGCNVI